MFCFISPQCSNLIKLPKQYFLTVGVSPLQWIGGPVNNAEESAPADDTAPEPVIAPEPTAPTVDTATEPAIADSAEAVGVDDGGIDITTQVPHQWILMMGAVTMHLRTALQFRNRALQSIAEAQTSVDVPLINRICCFVHGL